MLFCLLLLVVACGPTGEDAGLKDRIRASLVGRGPGDHVDLASAFGTDWDRVLLFEGQPLPETVQQIVGFEWSGYEAGMGDGTTVVLTRGDRVARWSYLPWSGGGSTGDFVDVEYGEIAFWVEVDPSNMDFVIRSFDGTGSAVLCYQACP